MSTPAIVYQALSKSYGKQEVIRALSLTIEQGEFVTIVGASGCGKTTLLKLTNGLLSPDILLMDEPFGAVDELTRAQLQEELARIHAQTGITILFVTHDMSEALRLGTHVLVIEAGTVAQYGTPDELRAAPASAYVEKLMRGRV